MYRILTMYISESYERKNLLLKSYTMTADSCGIRKPSAEMEVVSGTVHFTYTYINTSKV